MSKQHALPSMAPSEADYVPGRDAPLRLLTHCAAKSAQVASIGGVALATARALRGRPVMPPALRTVATCFYAGTSVLTAVCALKIGTLDEEGVTDRVYRLHYNAGQHRTDRFAFVYGAPPGATLGALLGAGSMGLATAAVGGAAAGIAVGVAAHVVTKKVE